MDFTGKGSSETGRNDRGVLGFRVSVLREVQATLKQVMQRYGNEVRLVFKHLPLEGHRNSLPAARAAYCAAEQDRFWQFHDALFASGNLSPACVRRDCGGARS